MGLSTNDIIRAVKDGFGIEVNKMWVSRLRDRNKAYLRSRKPMVCTKARSRVADEALIYKYVNTLHRMFAQASFGPHQIINYDESRLYVGPDNIKYSRVTEAAWKMKPQRIVDAGKSQTGSVLPFVSAASEIIFVAIVTKLLGERSKVSFSEELNKNSRNVATHKIYFSDTSYVDGKLFEEILNDFAAEWERRHPGLYCMVIGDNLSVHEDIKLRGIMLGRGLHMVFLPPNTTHWSQPLDTILFGLLKTVARALVASRSFDNMLSAVKTYYCLVEVALRSIKEAFTPSAIRRAFREAGLYPFNADKILSRIGALLEERNNTARHPAQDHATKFLSNVVGAAEKRSHRTSETQVTVGAIVYNRCQGRTTAEVIQETIQEKATKERAKKEKEEEKARKEAERLRKKEEKEAAKVQRAAKRQKNKEENALKRKVREEERKLRTCCMTECTRMHRVGGGNGWLGCDYCDFFWMCKSCSTNLDNQKLLEIHEKHRCPHKPSKRRKKI